MDAVARIYAEAIKTMPAAERLRLAQMILNDIPQQAVIDYSDEWSDEDIQDFTNASWRLMASREPDSNDA